MTEEKDYDPAALASKWQVELELAKRTDEKWIERGKKIVKRYRDERNGITDSGKRYNILWSNIRTLLPATYAKKPKAEVSRRYKDSDPVARAASELLERALQFEIDQYSDYDNAIKHAVLDRLLAGRGVAWVRFEPTEQQQEVEGEEPQVYDDVENELPFETSPVDYVYWEDFRHSPARTWEEVSWVARRVYMTKQEGEERFGESFAKVPLSHEPIGIDEMKKEGSASGQQTDAMKKAKVWEIWDKSEKTACWYAEGYSEILDCRPDPLGLDTFFPCPKPLFSTTTTDTLVPVPDYAMYQDQAKEMDELTQRIALLVKAVKVVGVYDSSQTGVQRMLNEGVDNTLIGVDTWAAFGEKGGLKGTIDFLPIDMVLMALKGLYEAREACKQVIYEITGLSDIIRGASVASETATAQQIKSQYASLRLKEMQGDVARFASDLLRLKAQIMCDLYRPETLVQMSGIQGTPDAQLIEPAMQLLKSEVIRGFRIQVDSDTLVEMDEQKAKQERIEFLTAAGSFLNGAVKMVEAAPELGPLAAEMLMFGVRSFKQANTLEPVFEQAIQQMQAPKPEQGPNPEMMKVQAQQQAEQARMQMDAQKHQAEMQARMQEQQMQAQIDAQRNEMEAQRQAQQLENARMIEQFKVEQQTNLEAARLEFERWKAELDAQTKITVAQISAQTTLEQAQLSAAQAASDDRAML